MATRCASSCSVLRLLAVSVAAAAIALAGCGDASGTGDLWRNGEPDPGAGGDPSASGGGGTSGGSGGGTTNGATGGTSGNTQGDTTGGQQQQQQQQQQGTFAIALDKTTADTELMMKTDYTVTLTPSNGFTGSVALAATGLPTGATAIFTPATLDVTGTAPMTAKLEIDTPSTVTPTGATPLAVKVMGTGTGAVSAVTGSADLALNVKAKISFYIPNNAPNQPNVFGVPSVTVNMATISSQNPLTVVITNLDASRDHVIHANSVNGFIHGDTNNPLQLNQSMTRMVTGKGNYPFYLHDLSGTNPSTTLKIQ